ncbi:MAG: hypothetical protein HYR79_10340 [Nitrospirae bacterium]|nr:hypothetical protein [Nitrospirota bacterium]
MNLKYIAIAGGGLSILTALVLTWPNWLPIWLPINSPPLYEKDAREYLQKKEVSSEVIRKLEERKLLSEAEVLELSKFKNVAVLHLLASNPGATEDLLRQLADHRSKVVLWGVASNKNTPLEILLKFRTPGDYTTMNCYLARNPGLPEPLIREMYKQGEASLFDFALNESLPADLMEELLSKDETVRFGLSLNLKIPDHICQALANDPDELVRRNLRKKCPVQPAGK